MQRYFKGFRRFLRVLGVATILATLAATAWADDAWRVTEVAGTARVNQGDGKWTAVAVGTVIAPSGIVETGANGRVVLKSAKDEATMSPNSRMAAPKPGEAENSNIVQKLGTLLFKIERAPSRRFAVDTPYLAAVVKGTTFTVTVGADAGLVHVTEGAVLVASFGSRETALVTPGQTAQVVAAGGKLQVIGRGQSLPVPPRASGGSGDTQDKKSSKEFDPADRNMIEKGRAEFAQIISAAPADEGKDNAKGGMIVSAKSDRPIQVAALDGGSASKGSQASSVLVISSTLGAQSIDVARATDGFIAGLPADSRPSNTGANGKSGNSGSSSGAASTSDNGASNGNGSANGGSSNTGSNSGGNANSNSGGNGNSNAGGNGNSNAGGNGNSNAGGNGNSNAGGNGNSNAGGNGNSNAGGNGNSGSAPGLVASLTGALTGNGNGGNANSNAGGNGNGGASAAAPATPAPAPVVAAAPSAPPTTGLMPLGAALPAVNTPSAAVVAGNGNGNGNGNAGGNGNGNGNGNAGGNGNGNGFGNGNAGGNGNGNGNAGASAPAAAAPAPAPAVSTPVIPPAAAPVVSAPVVSAPPVVASLGAALSSPGQGLAKGKNK